MSIQQIIQKSRKYENLDLFQFIVNEIIWIYLRSVGYFLIVHLQKCPHKDYENYLLVRYFYLCSEPSYCTNVNKTCNIDSKLQYLYSKNASYHFPSNELKLQAKKYNVQKLFTFVQ